MLVISRRAKDKVSFPEVGITVHFIRVQSGTVKVGIDAPMQISIVRDEVAADEAAQARSVRSELLSLPKEIRHSIRNELHAVSVGVHLMREQMKMGLQDDAQETFKTIKDSLKRLDENHVLRRRSIADQAGSTAARSVLVVEDDVNQRELLAAVLRMNGYDVAVAGDGEDALEYLASHETPSAIVLDMRMPRCDGISTVREIRADARYRKTRLFAISGAPREECDIETGPLGVERWFPKPVDVDHLISALACEAS